MIIFFNKTTGDIVGTINDRIHGEGHLNMYIGTPKENDRLIVQWKEVGTERLEDGSKAIISAPDLDTKEQRDIFSIIERGEAHPNDYKVDTKTKNLVKI